MITRLLVGGAMLIALLFLASCATTGMTQSERIEAYEQFIIDQKLEKKDVITSFRFDGWNDLSDEHLILYTQFNKPYLVKLRRGCIDLRHTMGIRVHNSGSLLQARFDYITIPDSMVGRCYMQAIYPLTLEQRDAIYKVGKTTKDEQVPEKKPAQTNPAETPDQSSD